MAKGITPVIALILLLVITIVIVGFTFTIFQGITSTAGNAAENQTSETTQRLSSCIRLESVNANGDIYVRNCGSSDITAGSVSVYAKPQGGSYTLLAVTNGNANIQKDSIGTLQVDYGSLPSGTYDVRVVSASGVSDVMNDQDINTVNPSVKLKRPVQNENFPNPPENVPFECNATAKNGRNIATLELQTDRTGSMQPEAGCTVNGLGTATAILTCTINNMATGTYHWTCKAVDDNIPVGNEGIAQPQAFTVGNVQGNPPVTTLDLPADDPAGSNPDVDGTVDFSCHATDADGDLQSLTLRVDGIDRACTPAGNGNRLDITNCGVSLANGMHTWNCLGRDNAGNTDLAGADYRVWVNVPGAPLNPPTITLNSPANGSSFIAPANIPFDCTATPAGANTITALELWTDTGGSWGLVYTDPTPADGHLASTINNVPAGTYKWNCRANDNDTQTGEGWFATNYTLTVNAPLNPPIVNLVSPGNNTVITGPAMVNFTCDASDNSALTKTGLYYTDPGQQALVRRDTYYPYKKNILAPNADFELNPRSTGLGQYNESYWPWCTNASANGYCSWTPGLGIDGSNGARLGGGGVAGDVTLTRYLTTNWNYTGAPLLKNRTTYIISGYISGSNNPTVVVRIFDGELTWAMGPYINVGSWRYISRTFSTGDRTVNASINITAQSIDASKQVTIDNFQVEELGETGQTQPTNFTDRRSYLSVEETDDACDTPTSCEDTVTSTYVSGATDAANPLDGLWERTTMNDAYDGDYLTCWAGEPTCNATIRLPVQNNGTYEFVANIYASNTAVLKASFDNGSSWVNANFVPIVRAFYPIANVTVTGGSLTVMLNKTNGIVQLDRIRLVPQRMKSYRPVFPQLMTAGAYKWACDASDDEGNSAFSPASYTLSVI